jgi:hypothetical protein
VAQNEDPEFKSQDCKKEKEKFVIKMAPTHVNISIHT